MAIIWTSRTRARGQRAPSRVAGINLASPISRGLRHFIWPIPSGFFDFGDDTPGALTRTGTKAALVHKDGIPMQDVRAGNVYWETVNGTPAFGGNPGNGFTVAGWVVPGDFTNPASVDSRYFLSARNNANNRYVNVGYKAHPSDANQREVLADGKFSGSAIFLEGNNQFTAAEAVLARPAVLRADPNATDTLTYFERTNKRATTTSTLGTDMVMDDFIRIGVDRNANGYFDGYIGPVLVWDRPLNDFEVAAYVNSPWDVAKTVSRTYIIPAAAGGATNVTPTAASLTLTGESPSVALKLNVAPTAAALAITGESPGVVTSSGIAVTAGSISLTGESPSVALKFNAAVAAGSLTLTGESPGVALKLNAAVTAGALTLTGESPSVATGLQASVTAGSLTLTGESPSVTLKVNVAPTAGALTFTGEAPDVNVQAAGSIDPAAASLTLTGESPSVALKLNVAPTAGALTVTGEEPAVALKQALSVTAGALTFTGESPGVTVDTSANFNVTAQDLTLTGATPTVALLVNVSPTAGAITFTGSTVSITSTESVTTDGRTLTVEASDRTISVA